MRGKEMYKIGLRIEAPRKGNEAKEQNDGIYSFHVYKKDKCIKMQTLSKVSRSRLLRIFSIFSSRPSFRKRNSFIDLIELRAPAPLPDTSSMSAKGIPLTTSSKNQVFM